MSDETWLTHEQCLQIERQIDALCRASEHFQAANLAEAYADKVPPLSEFHSRAIYLHAFSYFLGGYYTNAWETIQVGLSLVNQLPPPVLPRLYLLACEIAIACRRTEDANSVLNEYHRLPKKLKSEVILEVKLIRIELILKNSKEIALAADRMVRRLIASGKDREAAFVLCDLGSMYLRNGDAEKADKNWRRGLQVGNAVPAIQSDLLIHLGRSQQLKGRLQSAINLYMQAAELATNSVQRCDALIRKSLVRFDLNQIEDASEELQVAISSLEKPYPESLLPLIRFASKNIDGREIEWENNNDMGWLDSLNNDSLSTDNEVSRKAYRRGNELWIAGLENDAESWLRTAWKYAQENSNLEVAWRSAVFLGRITGKRDIQNSCTKQYSQHPESLLWFSRALDILEKQSETIDTPVNRAHYRFQLRSIALELFEGSVRSGDVQNAFRYSELLRGRLLADFFSQNANAKSGKHSFLNWLGIGGAFRKSTEGVEAIKKRLGHGEVFISLAELDSCVSAIVITSDGEPELRTKELDGESLQIAKNNLECCLEDQLSAYRNGAELDTLKQDFCNMLTDISKSELGKLIGDILRKFKHKVVLLSLDGRLGNIPVHALPFNGRFLIETREVAYVPIGNWLSRDPVLRQLTKHSRGLLISEAEESLPNAKTEALQIQYRFRRSFHLHAMEANTTNVENAIKQCDFLHFACHGETNSDSPLNASLQLPSGQEWTAGFVAKSLNLNGKLCVLNCCKTGEQRKQVAGETFSIATSYLAAGAASVVAALWSLPDEESAFLIGKFYDYLQSESPIHAIARVQREAIASGMHPLFWAPFVYIGTSREKQLRFGFI